MWVVVELVKLSKNAMNNRMSFFWISFCIVAVLLIGENDGFQIGRRSAAPERTSDDYPDYQLGVKYDEYPMIVPKKRAAFLIDRLMVALQNAIEEEEAEARAKAESMAKSKSYSIRSEDAVRAMDLQRRGHGGMSGQQKSRSYIRCYFNAVTCFK